MSFPALTLLDSFKRKEEPLSNEGKWKGFFPLKGNGGVGGAEGKGWCNGTDWEMSSTAWVEGGYWTPAEFSEPAVAITRDKNITDEGYWSLWCCISHPTTSEISGYRLKWKHEGSNFFEAKLERCDKNVFTVLETKAADGPFEAGDKIGIAVNGGKVQYWTNKKSAGWAEIASAADGTYTKGFVGFAVSGADGDTTNFEVGSITTPSVENPGTQKNRISKEVSVQVHAQNALKYFATNLPKGLSISESTGLITGEPTTVETPIVKIKVENEAKETAETSFEWVIYKVANITNMVVS